MNPSRDPLQPRSIHFLDMSYLFILMLHVSFQIGTIATPLGGCMWASLGHPSLLRARWSLGWSSSPYHLLRTHKSGTLDASQASPSIPMNLSIKNVTAVRRRHYISIGIHFSIIRQRVMIDDPLICLGRIAILSQNASPISCLFLSSPMGSLYSCQLPFTLLLSLCCDRNESWSWSFLAGILMMLTLATWHG